MVAIDASKVATASGHGVLDECPARRPPLSLFVCVLASMAVIGGFLFGYDTGIVSSAMIFVPRSPDLTPVDNLWRELIISVTPGMAGISAICAGVFSNTYGRKPTIVASSVIFTVGALVCAIGISVYVLLLGRALLGIAIGIASMIVPIYVSETSPAHVRGRLIFGFQLMIVFGQMASNIIAGVFSYISPETVGWRLMLGFASVPALIQLIGFAFLPESPRYLYAKQGREAARVVLDRIYSRDTEWIDYELHEIDSAHQQQLRERAIYGDDNLLKRILTTPSVRRALIIGCALQIFQQLSGINTIMYYTSTIIQSAGIRDNHKTIWISVGTSSMNFIFGVVPLLLIDRLGRRKLLLISAAGVALCLLALSGAFLLINRDSAPSLTLSNTNFTLSTTTSDICAQYSNCDFCVTHERCGFCGIRSDNGGDVYGGYCYTASQQAPDDFAANGHCATSRNSSSTVDTSVYEWSKSFCATDYTILPIAIVFLYLCFHSIGFGPMPWVLNAEFYPLWARSTCVSLSTFCNWAFNLLVSITFLSLVELTTKHGTFLIYACVTALALGYFALSVPETKGRELDEIEQLFMTKEERRALASSCALASRVSSKPC